MWKSRGQFGRDAWGEKSERPKIFQLTEITKQTHVVALHADTRRDQHAPRDSLRIQLDALEQAHRMLAVGGSPSIADELVHGTGLVEVVLGREVQRSIVRHDIIGRLGGSHGCLIF